MRTVLTLIITLLLSLSGKAQDMCTQIKKLIVAAGNNNFDTYKAGNLPGQTNMWYSNNQVEGTSGNKIITYFDFKSNPLNTEYTVVLLDNSDRQKQSAAAMMTAWERKVDACNLIGYTKKKIESPKTAYSDERSADIVAIEWNNTQGKNVMTIKSMFDILSKKYQLVILFKGIRK